MENCEKAYALHNHQLAQHTEALAKLDGVPQALQGLTDAVARINRTMDRLDEKAQTKDACTAVHKALETLRAEQLITLRKNITENTDRLDEREEQRKLDDVAHEKRHKDAETELNEIRGALKFLKFVIPLAIAISPAIAAVVLHMYGR